MFKVITLLVGGIFAGFGLIDQLVFRRKLHRTIPHLDQLLRDPWEMLRQRPLAIGPRRRYFMAIPLTILYWLLSCLAIGVLWVGVAWVVIWFRGDITLLTIPTLCLVGLAGVGSAALALWQGHGGQMFLSEQGVDLYYRWTTVCCPWDLFTAAGEPRRAPKGEDVHVSIRPQAIPQIEVYRRGKKDSRTTVVQTVQFQAFGQHAKLSDQYKVDPLELAQLLQKIGRGIITQS